MKHCLRKLAALKKKSFTFCNAGRLRDDLLTISFCRRDVWNEPITMKLKFVDECADGTQLFGR